MISGKSLLNYTDSILMTIKRMTREYGSTTKTNMREKK